jgi:AraC-like DNA-binding protein
MLLHIKNMVCNRCILVVQNELQSLGFKPLKVELGEVELPAEPSVSELEAISEHLHKFGFELIDSSNGRTIEKIRNLVIKLVHYSDQHRNINLSEYIASNMKKDYTYLSNLFSQTQGLTIEKYYINQKIERVKELLVYDELSLTEIADLLDYSSVSYLSNQFRKVTGLTPGHFKKIRDQKRKPLDQV